jgi:hypothetical protein
LGIPSTSAFLGKNETLLIACKTFLFKKGFYIDIEEEEFFKDGKG